MTQRLFCFLTAIACISACGDSSKSSQREKITIGYMMPLTSTILASQALGWEYAVKVAQDNINAAGGVLGKDISLDIRDTEQSTSDLNGQIAQAFIDSGVKLMVDSDGSSAPNGAIDATLASDALLLVTVAGGDSIRTKDPAPPAGKDLVFRPATSNLLAGQATARYASSMNAGKVAIIASSSPTCQDAAKYFSQTYESLGGELSLFDTAKWYTIVSGTSNAAILDAVAATNPDAIFLTAASTTAYPLLNEAIAKSVLGNYTWYLDGMLREDTLFTTVSQNEGFRGVLSGDIAAQLALKASVEAAAGTSIATISRLAENYDAVYLMALAIAKAGTTEPLAVRDALREVAGPPGTMVGPTDFAMALSLVAQGADINYEGISGSVDFDADGDVANKMDFWQTHNGHFESTGYSWTP